MKFIKVLFKTKNVQSLGFCTLLVLLILSGLLWFCLLVFEHELTTYRIAREQATFYQRDLLIESAHTYAGLFVQRMHAAKNYRGVHAIKDWGLLNGELVGIRLEWYCEHAPYRVDVWVSGKNIADYDQAVLTPPTDKQGKGSWQVVWQSRPAA